MIKSSQNVIGSVMCCPGCFSLYRVAALRDIRESYSEPCRQATDVFIKDTGIDLLLIDWVKRISLNTTIISDRRRSPSIGSFEASFMKINTLTLNYVSNVCTNLVNTLHQHCTSYCKY